MAKKAQHRQYQRFGAPERFEHFVLLVSMVGLAVTGLPQRYASMDWAQTMISIMGGIESVRVIHRFMAFLLIAEAIYHGGAISYKVYVLGKRATLLPGLRDLRDVANWVMHNMGLKKEHPRLPRYNFGEKAEYLAVVWGTVIMGITGFMMWNPIATAKFIPGSIIPVAKAAHSAEAVLAVLSIATWHMYNVHFKHFNKSMFTGKLSEEAMREEHAEELEQIENAEKPLVISEQILASRRRRFWPFAIVMGAVLVVGLVWFITLEETAITTVPRQENTLIFAPREIEATGNAEIGREMWSRVRCSLCHGMFAAGSPEGTPRLLGTSLPFEDFYRQVRQGSGENMPGFSAAEVPDQVLLDIWTWLQEESSP